MSLLVQVFPDRLPAVTDEPAVVTVVVTNTRDVISGYRVRVLGLDEAWVRLDTPALSLFPGDVGTCLVTVTLPPGVAAGSHQASVQVVERTGPGEVALLGVQLEVPSVTGAELRLDPRTVTGGRRGGFALLVQNTGNTSIALPLVGTDEERKATFTFDPPSVMLPPGDQAAVQVVVRAPRRLVGAVTVRPVQLALGDLEKPVGRPAMGTFVQRPVVPRGGVSLLGLLAAITVFAVLISVALTRVVATTAADRDLALQVATARNAGLKTGAQSLAGTVRLLTSGSVVPGVTVDLFAAADTANPVTSAATGTAGTYAFPGLQSGSYKIRFRGAGFAELYYPNSLTAADAGTVDLAPGQQATGIDVLLGGLPGSLTGVVTGDDTAGAVVTLQVPGGTLPDPAAAAAGVAGAGTTGAQTAGLQPAPAPAQDVPAPVVAPPPGGTGSVAQAADTGRNRSLAVPQDLLDVLADPDALPPAAPVSTGSLLGALSTLPAGAGTAPAVSDPLQAGAVLKSVVVGAGGAFTLTQVPSPAVYQLVVTKPGFATNVQVVDLGGGEQRSGITIRLSRGDGLVGGHVLGSNGVIAGATVSATDGQTTQQTVTATTGDVGGFTLRNLPTPSNLVVTVSANGLASQTIALTLAAGQQLTGVDVTLSGSAATITGSVQVTGASSAAGVAVSVTNGALTLQTVTTSSAAGSGTWRLGGLPVPGSYTITFSRSDLASQTISVTLAQSATTSPTAVQPVTLTSSTASLRGVAYSAPLAPGGTPASQGVGGVQVVLTSGTTTYQVTTVSVPAGVRGYPGPPTGSYAVDRLPPGTYTVTFTRPGAKGTSALVTLAAGDRAMLDSPLQPSSQIIAKTYTKAGTNSCAGPANCPLGEVAVRVFPADTYPDVPSQTGVTPPSGTDTGIVRFPGLDAPENYVVDFAYPSAASPQASGTVSLTPSQTCTVVFVTNGTVADPVTTSCGPTGGTPTRPSTSPTAPSQAPSELPSTEASESP